MHFFFFKETIEKCEYVCAETASRCLRLASVTAHQRNISDGIAVETRHHLPAASNSFASGRKQSPDTDREIIMMNMVWWDSH